MSAKVERKTPDIVPAGCKLRPLKDKIVVRVIDFNYSATLVHTYHGSPVRGEVVSVGPGRYPNIYRQGTKDGKAWRTVHESLHFRPTELKVGDIVEFGGLELQGYAFQRVLMDGYDHVVCSEQDVAGVRLVPRGAHFTPIRDDCNAWMAARTRAEMIEYADTKLMPRRIILETWRTERKKLRVTQ